MCKKSVKFSGSNIQDTLNSLFDQLLRFVAIHI